jgi:hypothetical protein
LANSYNKNGQIEKLDQSEDTRDAHYRRGLLIAPRKTREANYLLTHRALKSAIACLRDAA